MPNTASGVLGLATSATFPENTLNAAQKLTEADMSFANLNSIPGLSPS